MKKIPEKKIKKRKIKLSLYLFLPLFALVSFVLLYVGFHYASTPRVLALMSTRRHNYTRYVKPVNQINPINSVNPAFFYGINADMSQLLPGSQRYVVNSKGEDLVDVAARLGVNIIRITNATSAFDNVQGTVYSKKQWYQVLDKMQQKGIRALVLIESPVIHQKNITTDYLPFVQSYTLDSGVLSHPDIYGVDLYNEPVINTNNINVMNTAAQMIKAAYPTTKLTVGWWAVDTLKKDANGNEVLNWNNYSAGKELDSFIDFYSIHMYGFDEATLGIYPDPYVFTQSFISQIENSLSTTKPVLIEEFGAANGEAVSDQDTLGSPQLQANTYAGIYQALLDMKDKQVLGTVAYQFNSRVNGPDAWTILKNNGNSLLPAAYVLQKYATGKSDIPLFLPLSPIPNSYLFHHGDNNKTVTLQVNDILGLSLSLDPMFTYAVAFSGDNTLSQSQTLTYISYKKTYEVVFHAAGTGTTQLTVTQKQNCPNTVQCNSPSNTVFSLTVVTK